MFYKKKKRKKEAEVLGCETKGRCVFTYVLCLYMFVTNFGAQHEKKVVFFSPVCVPMCVQLHLCQCVHSCMRVCGCIDPLLAAGL